MNNPNPPPTSRPQQQQSTPLSESFPIDISESFQQQQLSSKPNSNSRPPPVPPPVSIPNHYQHQQHQSLFTDDISPTDDPLTASSAASRDLDRLFQSPTRFGLLSASSNPSTAGGSTDHTPFSVSTLTASNQQFHSLQQQQKHQTNNNGNNHVAQSQNDIVQSRQQQQQQQQNESHIPRGTVDCHASYQAQMRRSLHHSQQQQQQQEKTVTSNTNNNNSNDTNQSTPNVSSHNHSSSHAQQQQTTSSLLKRQQQQRHTQKPSIYRNFNDSQSKQYQQQQQNPPPYAQLTPSLIHHHQQQQQHQQHAKRKQQKQIFVQNGGPSSSMHRSHNQQILPSSSNNDPNVIPTSSGVQQLTFNSNSYQQQQQQQHHHQLQHHHHQQQALQQQHQQQHAVAQSSIGARSLHPNNGNVMHQHRRYAVEPLLSSTNANAVLTSRHMTTSPTPSTSTDVGKGTSTSTKLTTSGTAAPSNNPKTHGRVAPPPSYTAGTSTSGSSMPIDTVGGSRGMGTTTSHGHVNMVGPLTSNVGVRKSKAKLPKSSKASNRVSTAEAVRLAAQMDRPPTRRSSKGGWTCDEDDMLRVVVMEHNEKNWKDIAKALNSSFPGSNRNDVQCLHRWQKVLQPGLKKGPWTPHEDETITRLVGSLGASKWSLIAKQLPGRIGKQCRERWFNHLNPEINKTPWTDTEERILKEAHSKFGNKWAIIAKYLPGRTDNAIKNHYNATKRRDATRRGRKAKGKASLSGMTNSATAPSASTSSAGSSVNINAHSLMPGNASSSVCVAAPHHASGPVSSSGHAAATPSPVLSEVNRSTTTSTTTAVVNRNVNVNVSGVLPMISGGGAVQASTVVNQINMGKRSMMVTTNTGQQQAPPSQLMAASNSGVTVNTTNTPTGTNVTRIAPRPSTLNLGSDSCSVSAANGGQVTASSGRGNNVDDNNSDETATPNNAAELDIVFSASMSGYPLSDVTNKALPRHQKQSATISTKADMQSGQNQSDQNQSPKQDQEHQQENSYYQNPIRRKRSSATSPIAATCKPAAKRSKSTTIRKNNGNSIISGVGHSTLPIASPLQASSKPDETTTDTTTTPTETNNNNNQLRNASQSEVHISSALPPPPTLDQEDTIEIDVRMNDVNSEGKMLGSANRGANGGVGMMSPFGIDDGGMSNFSSYIQSMDLIMTPKSALAGGTGLDTPVSASLSRLIPRGTPREVHDVGLGGGHSTARRLHESSPEFSIQICTPREVINNGSLSIEDALQTPQKGFSTNFSSSMDVDNDNNNNNNSDQNASSKKRINEGQEERERKVDEQVEILSSKKEHMKYKNNKEDDGDEDEQEDKENRPCSSYNVHNRNQQVNDMSSPLRTPSKRMNNALHECQPNNNLVNNNTNLTGTQQQQQPPTPLQAFNYSGGGIHHQQLISTSFSTPPRLLFSERPSVNRHHSRSIHRHNHHHHQPQESPGVYMFRSTTDAATTPANTGGSGVLSGLRSPGSLFFNSGGSGVLGSARIGSSSLFTSSGGVNTNINSSGGGAGGLGTHTPCTRSKRLPSLYDSGFGITPGTAGKDSGLFPPTFSPPHSSTGKVNQLITITGIGGDNVGQDMGEWTKRQLFSSTPQPNRKGEDDDDDDDDSRMRVPRRKRRRSGMNDAGEDEDGDNDKEDKKTSDNMDDDEIVDVIPSEKEGSETVTTGTEGGEDKKTDEGCDQDEEGRTKEDEERDEVCSKKVEGPKSAVKETQDGQEERELHEGTERHGTADEKKGTEGSNEKTSGMETAATVVAVAGSERNDMSSCKDMVMSTASGDTES